MQGKKHLSKELCFEYIMGMNFYLFNRIVSEDKHILII
jgi:hypothetical protein